ncbi:MAG: Dam family site-specific DNA-(adenine-N6)-methyltransferase [Pseudomonadota bacterium]
MSENLEPFLKWAGGKRWLTNTLTPYLKEDLGRYIEPFLGGGAMFFSLNPKCAILSDVNRDLINVYRQIRRRPSNFEEALYAHQKKHSEEFYYKERSKSYDCNFKSAVQFVYLNRTCFNGIYRVNLEGVFNVPMGSKTNIILPTDDFLEVARRLRGKDIDFLDFEAAIEEAGSGDTIYADPPYTVKHNFNGFVKYNDKIFQWADQIRLMQALERASKRGVRIVVSNANHASIKELYKGWYFSEVSRSSVISAASKHRGKTTEIIISNFNLRALDSVRASGAKYTQHSIL